MSNNGAALIPAQTIDGGLLSIVTDKGTATYSVASKAFAAGQLYTLPIIGATKERHVIEAAEAAKIQLTTEEMARLEALADATGIDTRGGWEHSME